MSEESFIAALKNEFSYADRQWLLSNNYIVKDSKYKYDYFVVIKPFLFLSYTAKYYKSSHNHVCKGDLIYIRPLP